MKKKPAEENEPTVHPLKSKQIIRKLKQSLEEADRDDTVSLGEAYDYWKHKKHGKGKQNGN